jgi:hypothetical protein
MKLVWWARRDLNPQGLFNQRILSPPRIPIPPLALELRGGTDEIRTRVNGFADRCLTPRPPRHQHDYTLFNRLKILPLYPRV